MNEQEQPTFGPKNIGEAPDGSPSVLRPTEKEPEVTPPSASTLPDAWDEANVAKLKAAEQGTLSGDEIEVQPAGTVEAPELKPGDIGYTDNQGNPPVITDK